MGDEEAVDHVELGGVPPVEPDDDAVLYHELGLGIRRPGGGDEPELGPGLDEQLAAELRRLPRDEAPLRGASAIGGEPPGTVRLDASRTNVAFRDAPSSSSRDAHASSSTGEERPGRSAV